MSTDNLPKCPACQEDMTYPDGENYVCAQCGHEWPMAAAAEEVEAGPHSQRRQWQSFDRWRYRDLD